ncbi:MAG: hypothetical protein J6U77_07745 [Verrucomicrobia bacterium]|jgi:ribosomal protein L19E|nr:hypothetical protein [Verrucomicrobiota bacterium]MBO7392377.1 hypothetical protein [Verrucomicrobiota bacterium]
MNRLSASGRRAVSEVSRGRRADHGRHHGEKKARMQEKSSLFFQKILSVNKFFEQKQKALPAAAERA